jgi:hypothetical protein
MPVIARDSEWIAEAAWDLPARECQIREQPATAAATYLPPPADTINVTDLEYWLDLCA